MEIIELLGYIKEYGISVTLLAIVLFFLFAFGQTGLEYLKRKLKPAVATNPRNHAFFSTSERLINYHIPRMHVSADPARNILFRDMLTNKISIWRESTLNFVVRDFSVLKTFEIKELFAKTLHDLISSYEADWKDSGIPEIIITKFAEWHSPRIEAISISATSIFDGKSFTTPNEMLNAILCLQNALLIETIIDAERTLGELNGEISGLSYQGLTLE